jgi:drug/metabolite transporter (DMT)-like permease
LTIGVFTLVLIAALCHAIWNTIIKLSPDKSLETSLMNLSGSLIAIPAVLYFGIPESEVWIFLLGSLILHIAYYYSLSGAYQWGDMSLTYPIMRGMAPFFLLLITSIFAFEPLLLSSIIGVCLLCSGIVFLGIDSARVLNHKKAILFALLNALVIALYTIVDGLGVRASHDVFAYIAMFIFIDGIIYSSFVIYRRQKSSQHLKQYMINRWPYFSLGAIATTGSYGIALWAMSEAPISLVSALREVSVLFAVFIAWVYLKEKLSKQRIAGVVLVLLGSFFIKAV